MAARQPPFSLMTVGTTAASDQRPSGVEAAPVVSRTRERRPDDPRVGDRPVTATPRSDVRPPMAAVGTTMRVVVGLGIGVGVGVGAVVALLLSAVQH